MLNRFRVGLGQIRAATLDEIGRSGRTKSPPKRAPRQWAGVLPVYLATFSAIQRPNDAAAFPLLVSFSSESGMGTGRYAKRSRNVGKSAAGTLRVESLLPVGETVYTAKEQSDAAQPTRMGGYPLRSLRRCPS